MRIPNFIIVGAPRSGTTSVYEWLRQHPDVFMSRRKEPAFFLFDGNEQAYCNSPKPDIYIDNWDDYVGLFDQTGACRAVGDASTLYLQSRTAPSRMHERLGTVKIIAILRDPGERAYSHFCLHRCTSLETHESFLDAVDAWKERAELGWMPNWDYIGPGFYTEHLRRYQKVFGAEQVLTLLFDDLSLNPQKTMREIAEFIGVDASFSFDTAKTHNPSAVPAQHTASRYFFSSIKTIQSIARILPHSVRSSIGRRLRSAASVKRPMSIDERSRMIDIFRQDILELETMLGRDLSAWRSLEPVRSSLSPAPSTLCANPHEDTTSVVKR